MSAPSPAIQAERSRAVVTAGEVLLAVLEGCRGNQRKAADALGYSVDTLRRRLRAAGYTAADLRERWPLADRQPKKST